MSISKIDCIETDTAFEFTIHIRMYPKKGTTYEEMEAFVAEKKKSVEDAWNDQDHSFEWEEGKPPKKVRIKIKVILLRERNDKKEGAGHVMGLNPRGGPKNKLADARNLFLLNSVSDWAHELGHIWGLGEEYSEDGQVTRDNLMGNGQSTKVEKYHLVTLLYVYHGSLSEEEKNRRLKMIVLIQTLGWGEARIQGEPNGIKEKDFDNLRKFLDRNKTSIQPKRPANPK